MGFNRSIDISKEIAQIFEEEVSGQIQHQSPPVARADRSQEAVKEVTKNTLFIDVNDNPTKKGIKIQFALPAESADRDNMIKLTQKMKSKLNEGLSKFGLSVDVDKDVPYKNVIGFLIDLEEIRLLIKSIINGGESAEQNQDQEGEESTEAGTPQEEEDQTSI